MPFEGMNSSAKLQLNVYFNGHYLYWDSGQKRVIENSKCDKIKIDLTG
jgi:hypothetical protein